MIETGRSQGQGVAVSRRDVVRLMAFGLAAGAALAPGIRGAQARIFTGFIEGVAVGGYDAVSYHTQGEAIVGDPSITLEHEGATWRFATEANREAFAANPQAYAPQYGGHCAWAAAQGYLAQGDPEVWRIVDGRLFLNATEGVNRRWLRNLDAFIEQADANWPGLI